MFAAATPSRHDRRSIVDAALHLLDEVGLPDLSMRRLAAVLDVQPSALYWHFDSKQALLAAVADRILERVPADASDAHGVARGIRDALFTYRDGAEVVMSSFALGLGADRAHEQLVRVLPDTDPARAARSTSALLQFVLGHALVVQQRLHAASHGATDSPMDPASDIEETFDLGVTAFLRGLNTSEPPMKATAPGAPDHVPK